MHVDLSFNSLNVDDIKVMGDGLNENSTILGIHLMGNQAKVDEKGFIHPDKNPDISTYHVFTRLPCK